MSVGWLEQLVEIPTTSGREQSVIAWVRGWAGRRKGIVIDQDAHGNLLLTSDRSGDRPPLIATAHMDHPGFVVDGMAGRTVSALFRGGVLAEYFPGAAVEFFDRSGVVHAGTVVGFDASASTAEVRMAATVPLAVGDIGRWEFPARTLGPKGDLLRGHACDDLAGVAAALTAFEITRRKKSLGHFGVLLTRAEEEGFIGAIGAARSGSVSRDARLLSIETSRSFPDSPIGGGPIVRVGDLSSVFDSALTNAVTDTVRGRNLVHQRKLMVGGSCEATAFCAYGYSATGLCLALGNYHNMVDIDGVRAGWVAARLAPEEISIADFENLVVLMVACAEDLDTGDDLRSRLDARFERHRFLLGGPE